MDFPNILNALNTYNSLTSTKTGVDLDLSAENYRVFEDLQRKGIRLKDLVDRAETPTDPSVFKAMEQAVSEDLDVKAAKEALESARETAMCRMLMTDKGYSDAYRTYHDAVTKAYVKPKATPDEPTD